MRLLPDECEEIYIFLAIADQALGEPVCCRSLDAARHTLDFTQPVAVMLIGVLHCIPDADDPYGIVTRLLAAVPPGSYLVVGHPASDVEAEDSARPLREVGLLAA